MQGFYRTSPRDASVLSSVAFTPDQRILPGELRCAFYEYREYTVVGAPPRQPKFTRRWNKGD